jgi:hypothetical protein
MTRLEDEGVREARRVADLAAGAWDAHAGRGRGAAPCVQCSVAAQRRQVGALCEIGGRLYQARRDTAAALARERADAARPNPDQPVLFGVAG